MKVLRGSVWKFGDNVDTDVIFPSQYMLLPSIEAMKRHTFEPLMERFHERITPGDFVVAGENFGCGSSREQAAAVLKATGVGCVIAKSFARIFFRNAINIGLPVVVSTCHEDVSGGEVLSIDLTEGVIRAEGSGRTFHVHTFPEHIQNMIDAGGLLSFINRRDAGSVHPA